jgi:hypothetical protein
MYIFKSHHNFYTLFVVFILPFAFLPISLNAQTDNSELKKMYEEDQGDRKVNPIDWEVLHERDKQREGRVYELLKTNVVVTGQDYYHAAMIFQHGHDTVASTMAIQCMQKSHCTR